MDINATLVQGEFIHINRQNTFILLGAPMSTVVTGITQDAIPLWDVKYFDVISKWQNCAEEKQVDGISAHFSDPNNNNNNNNNNGKKAVR